MRAFLFFTFHQDIYERQYSRRRSLNSPSIHRPLVATGKLGDKSTLADYLQARETPSPRRPLAELVAEGDFSL